MWWTGGNDIGWEGNWTWAKSKKPVGDFVWHSGQPINGMEENCLGLTPYSTANYDGVDGSCETVLYPNGPYPICQLNL